MSRRANREGGIRKLRDGRYSIRFTDASGVQRERRTVARSQRHALNLLDEELKRIEIAQLVPRDLREPTVGDLHEFRLRWLKQQDRTLHDAKARWAALGPHFGTVDANGVTTAMLLDYVERRRATVEKSTVNRELAELRRTLRLGAQMTPPLVHRIPRFEMADESDLVREGFFEPDEWARLQEHLAEHLRPMFALAYWLGWRTGELKRLQWTQVDLERGAIRIPSGRTKNKRGRVVYLPPDALAVLIEQRAAVTCYEREHQRVVPWVFPYRGKPIRDYWRGWRTAVTKAGLVGKLAHDFRRTAARNYVRAGTPESVVMKITGHLSRRVFDRYNITSEEDLADAAQRVSEYVRSRATLTTPLRDRKRSGSGGSGSKEKP